MKHIFGTIPYLFAAMLAVTSCETVIAPNLEQVENVLAVDAWINNKRGAQKITLAMTQSYFDNALPPGVSGALVTVENTTSGKLYSFVESGKGTYVWTPSSNADRIGKSGDSFRLSINALGQTYESFTAMGRVPVIDSLSFTFEKKNSFLPDSYNAEFWATDPAGAGDTYWIRATKNDTLLNKPSEISLAFDAGFSSGSTFDGIIFIPPVRSSVNPFNEDKDGNLLSPYQPGDKLYVEIQSISLAAFNYLNEVKTQTDRPGGFQELFSSPIANVSTNITNTSVNGKKAVGFFNVAAASGLGRTLTLKK